MIFAKHVDKNSARPNGIVIAGGGTGGHVYPAIAIADALVRSGVPKSDVTFLGSRRGIESRVVPEAGYTIRLLRGRGITRKLSLSSLIATIALMIGVITGMVYVARLRPKVIVSVGGYAALPCCVASVLLGIPLVLAEANAVPGAVHRLFSRFARASATAFPHTALRNARMVGNPVRADVAQLRDAQCSQKRAARHKLGIPESRVLVSSIGGSLGARRINDAILALQDTWRDRTDIALYHVAGARDFGDIERQSATRNDGNLWYRVVEYQSDMAVLYAASDVMITRAGATTCAELAVVGMPAIVVPLPNTPGDHQVANANALEASGGAYVVRDDECDGHRLADVLAPVVADADLRSCMAARLRTLGQPNAADSVASIVREVMEKAHDANR